MSDHDDAQDYTANGPTDVGFRTGGDGTGIAKGVLAQGTVVGVHGIGSGPANSIAEVSGVLGESKTGTGVKGRSFRGIGVVGVTDDPDSSAISGLAQGGDGVTGFSLTGAGVRGSSNQNDGVVGTCQIDRKSGVFGDHNNPRVTGFGVSGRTQSVGGAGVFGFSDLGGNGVKGFSSTNDAVVGTANTERKSGVFGDNTNTTGIAFGVSGRTQSPLGVGVFGFSDVGGVGVRGFSNNNDGIAGVSGGETKSGVFGDHSNPTGVTFGVSGRSLSPQGAGVFGFSDAGYGGQFRGGRAPLRLEPAATIGRPASGSHQAGEFFVDANGDLFFCKIAGTPGTWALVQMS